MTILLILFVVSGFWESNPQKPSSVTNGAVINDAKLELQTTVIGQTYCNADHLRMSLRFTFLNAGTETLILYRHGAAIGRYMVSKDLKALRKRSYEYDVSPMIGPRMPPGIDDEYPSEELFVRLKSGESFTQDKNAYFLVTEGENSKEGLTAGTHVLKLQVVTLFLDSRQADTLAERWRNIGVLWSKDVVSSPMTFSIKAFNSSDSCR